jgi:hypothetical protein
MKPNYAPLRLLLSKQPLLMPGSTPLPLQAYHGNPNPESVSHFALLNARLAIKGRNSGHYNPFTQAMVLVQTRDTMDQYGLAQAGPRGSCRAAAARHARTGWGQPPLALGCAAEAGASLPACCVPAPAQHSLLRVPAACVSRAAGSGLPSQQDG